MNIFDFEAKLLNGKTVPLTDYEGKTLIIVNTASKCGLTPQYEGLENLYQKYRGDGLVVLGFPCNQFGKQEQGDSNEIQEFCEVNYGVSFPIFSKIEVNGKAAHPLFKFLKSQKGGLFGSKIKWNFTKFVIDKEGKPLKRFSPFTPPEKMESFIKKILPNE